MLRLTEHLKRIERSAKLYYMPVPYTVEQLYDATFEVLESNKLDACYIRPLVFRGYGEMGLFPMDAPVKVIIAAWPWGTYLGDEGVKHGVRAKTSSIQSLDHTALARAAKATGQYLNSILAKIEVLNAGYDEAVMLTEHGHVAEGSGENIFCVRNGVLMTPPPSDGVLEGITRDIVMNLAKSEGIELQERSLSRSDLVIADELFYTGTAAEVVPIREVDDHLIGEPGPVTRLMQERFAAITAGRTRSSATTWSTRGSSPGAGPSVRSGEDPMSAVQLYDTTLRDGMQQEGMSVSVDEKVRIALKLDELGIGFIEGGFPASNPKEIEFFRRMESERLANAELVAFGMTRRKGAPAEADDSLRVLAEIFTPTVAIVGKTWGLHLSKVIRVSRDENLRMIDESVRFLAAQGKRVVYDAEHFFDAWRDDREYALRCATAAAEAGAAVVCLCDTNGASACRRSSRTSSARSRRRSRTRSSASTRTTTATAPSPAASWLWRPAPARCRAPSTATASAAATPTSSASSRRSSSRWACDVVSDEQLERLTETSHFVADVVNAAIWAHAPYVGRSAFAHKGGMHVAAVEKAPQTFEHVDPEKVGNERQDRGVGALGQGRRGAQGAGAGPAARGRRRARRHRCSGGSRRASTRATTTRRPTPRSTSCCARSSRRTSRCSASRASA